MRDFTGILEYYGRPPTASDGRRGACAGGVLVLQRQSGMGLFLRKALRVGPLRFNLSKSGVGLSVGVTGMRFGVGPRGRYVHAGRHGVYYRKTLPSAGRRAPEDRAPGGSSRGAPHSGRLYEQPELQLPEIESASATLIQDSSSEELLEDIRRNRRRFPLATLCVTAAALVPAIAAGVPHSLILLVGLGFAIPIDRKRRKTVLFYELEPELQQTLEAWYQALDELGNCERLWHIPNADTPEGGRYTRTPVELRYRTPPFLNTNIDVPTLPAGPQTLYFMPDLVFVSDAKDIGAVSYHELEVEEFVTREAEQEAVPGDAEVVEWRWLHETKSGRADRRYKHNPQIPTVEYRRVLFKSASGLRELFQVSKRDHEHELQSRLQDLAHHTPSSDENE